MENDYKEKIELLLDELDEKTLRRLWLITAVMIGCNRKESKDIQVSDSDTLHNMTDRMELEP